MQKFNFPIVATPQDVSISFMFALLSANKPNLQSQSEPPTPPPTDEEKAFFELCKTFRKYQVGKIIVK